MAQLALLPTMPRREEGKVRRSDPTKWWARAFGGMFLAGSLVNIALVSKSSHAYDSFADGSYWSFIEHTWHSAVVPNVYVLIPLLSAFEATVGVLILLPRTRRLGVASAIAFSAALMLFGWGFWVWSLPVIFLLGYFWVLLGRPGDGQTQDES